MTAQSAAAPDLRDGYPLELRRWKGSYVARILGPDRDYGLEREFVDVAKLDKRWLSYKLTPGWYEYRQGEKHRNPKVYLAVEDPFHARELTEAEAEVIGDAAVGPPPGEAGAMFGNLCACGNDVEFYDVVGWPRGDCCKADAIVDAPRAEPNDAPF